MCIPTRGAPIPRPTIPCAPGNIAGSPYTYTGIIDFGEVHGADPFYDLGHALLHDGENGIPPLVGHLLDGACDRTGTLRSPTDHAAIQAQAIAIGVRHLAIASRRGSPYAATLVTRLGHLLDGPFAPDGDGRGVRP